MRSSSKANDITLFARARSTAWHRILVTLLAVPAVLVGLLAMHVLAGMGEPSGQHSTMATAAVMVPALDSNPPMTSVAGCDETCGPTHDMGVMACILALLLTALTVAAVSAFSGWRSVQAALAAMMTLVVHPRGLAPPLPPSLVLLSISRI